MSAPGLNQYNFGHLAAGAPLNSHNIHDGKGMPPGITTLARAPLFQGLVQPDYIRISAAGRMKEFSRGEMLYVEGDPVGQVSLLIRGNVKITKLGSTGSEVIVRLSEPGDVLGATDPSLTGKHSSTGQAFRLCRALVWDASAFSALMGLYPVMTQNLARILNSQLLTLEARFLDLATERVEVRVARQVARLVDQIGQQTGAGVEITLSREELAQMTGTTLFTVSRLLSAWEALKIVIPRREAVTICDIDLLRGLSRES